MKYFSRIHPALFLASSFTYLLILSMVTVSPDEIFRPFFVTLFFLIMIVWPAYWLTGDWDWTAVLLTVLVFGFFTSSSYFSFTGWFCVLALVLVFGSSYILKRPFTKKHLGILLSSISISLLVFNLLWFVAQDDFIPATYQDSLSTRKNSLLSVLTDQGQRPDIYYIVFDAYGRKDILQDYYGFDNSSFLDELGKRGFIVPRQSNSNYPMTALSVTSTINMNYVNEIAPGLQRSKYWWLMEPLIDRSEVRLELEQIGYQTVSITTGWSITDNSTTEHYLHPTEVVLSDYEGYLFTATPLGYLRPFLSKYMNFPTYSAHRSLIEFNFKTLANMYTLDSPKFVFAHLVVPHPPFVFNENGDPIDPDGAFSYWDATDIPITDEDYKNGYVAQVQYVNKEIIKLVDSLIANSKTPPVIILQADHGPRMLTDFRSSENTCLREIFSTFAAYYLPHANPGIIPENITSVNLFRIIFNEYFDAQLSLLENRNYFPQDPVRIYSLADVTAEVNTCSTQ